MPWVAGYEEDELLKSLGVTIKDIQPLANNCTEVNFFPIFHINVKYFILIIRLIADFSLAYKSDKAFLAKATKDNEARITDQHEFTVSTQLIASKKSCWTWIDE